MARSAFQQMIDDNPVQPQEVPTSWDTPEARRLLAAILAGSTPAASGPDHRVHRVRRRAVTTSAFLLGAAAVAVVIALVAGSSPTIVHPAVRATTTGASWRLVSSVASPFRSLPTAEGTVDCVTGEVCYTHGFGADPSDLFRTTDGGQTWSATARPPLAVGATGFDLSCATASACVVISSGGKQPGQLALLSLTSDGGRRWREVSVPALTMVNFSPKALCSAGGLRCVVGTGDAFLSTSDAGRTWALAATVAPPTGVADQLLWTWRCTSDGHCVALTSDTAADGALSLVARRSTNWGRTWHAGPALPAPGQPYASCPTATNCMVMTTDGPTGPLQIVTTDDGGVSWQVVGPPSGWADMPTALACGTATHCWIAVSTYSTANSYSTPTIEMTADGGRKWTDLALPATTPAIASIYKLSCSATGDGCLGVGMGSDHMQPTIQDPGSPPLVVSNLPPGR